MEEIAYLWSETKAEVGEYEILSRSFHFIATLRLFTPNDDALFYLQQTAVP